MLNLGLYRRGGCGWLSFRTVIVLFEQFWAGGVDVPSCLFCLSLLAFQVGAECHDHQQQYQSPHRLLPWIGGCFCHLPPLSLLLSSLPLPLSSVCPFGPRIGYTSIWSCWSRGVFCAVNSVGNCWGRARFPPSLGQGPLPLVLSHPPPSNCSWASALP